MLAIDARETAPASAPQHMFLNRTEDYVGKSDSVVNIVFVYFRSSCFYFGDFVVTNRTKYG